MKQQDIMGNQRSHRSLRGSPHTQLPAQALRPPAPTWHPGRPAQNRALRASLSALLARSCRAPTAPRGGVRESQPNGSRSRPRGAWLTSPIRWRCALWVHCTTNRNICTRRRVTDTSQGSEGSSRALCGVCSFRVQS